MGQTVIKLPAAESRAAGTRPRRWTREEYYRAAECGVFQPGERLELLDGEILLKTSPQRPPHAASLGMTARVLDATFGSGYDVRRQLPLALNDESEPEPDLLVVPGAPRDYAARHPTAIEACLVVEVSDSTLRLDRGRKLRAYARSGIQEYWIANLPQRRLEVYRNPSGSRYQNSTVYHEQDVVAPLAAPHARIRVTDLLSPPDEEQNAANGNGE
jgi:Uma2 family endonuclease